MGTLSVCIKLLFQSVLSVSVFLMPDKIGQEYESQLGMEPSSRFEMSHNESNQKVDIFLDGQLFTSYWYSSQLKKPVLYPLVTPRGTRITRKFPLEPSVGERVDHPHHVGLWFNYGDVNGLDFWNNSDAIKPEKRDRYGTIIHKEITTMEADDEKALLGVRMEWVGPTGEVLLEERTTFIFHTTDRQYMIDRITELSAPHTEVHFDDNKEGVLGIRVSRALEHPSDQPGTFSAADGNSVKMEQPNNEGVNGKYINAEGIEGTDTWGKRSAWVNLTSTIANEKISLVILDHPQNVGYPTYWHSRGYGLFAANPLGQAVFSKGKESLQFKLDKGQSTVFRHRILIASEWLTSQYLNGQLNDFGKRN